MGAGSHGGLDFLVVSISERGRYQRSLETQTKKSLQIKPLTFTIYIIISQLVLCILSELVHISRFVGEREQSRCSLKEIKHFFFIKYWMESEINVT